MTTNSKVMKLCFVSKLHRNTLFGLFPSKKNNMEKWHENHTHSNLRKNIQTKVIN